ncbi:MAG: hypothetical protein DRR08_26675 [Candidatus Parabeggiatoa sp. nov. 2]|nr:MAG: hypothetical protein B6247_25910 [Beggiatoa sp. 4572_84]RKZ54211.1 MAG: hypothetical protein DRR08_26675 [Gammaproteobacteria bacterium]
MLIFHHIGKTAGTSLRNLLKRNYQPHELLELYGPNRGSVDWYRNFYHSLSATQKSSTKCIAAHSAHFIIPVLQGFQNATLENPANIRFQAFCLLRDPVDRIISWYYFARTVANKDKGGSGQVGRILNQFNWKIEDIYLNLGSGDETTSEQHKLFRHFFNGQARTILAPHISTEGLKYIYEPISDNLYEDKLWAILQNYYTVGTQEHYQESVKYFAHQFGWKDLVYVKENMTPARPKLSELPDDVIALIRAYNDLDTKLHNIYTKQFERVMDSG